MNRKAAVLIAALVLSLGVSSATARTDAPVTVHVEGAAVGTALERVWAYHGYDEVNYTTTPEGRELLRTLSAAHTAPVHVRSHFLFNTGDGTPALKWGSTNIYTEDAEGNPVYDYTLIDEIMDATVDAGAFPLVEIGFMPEALSTRPDPYRNSDTAMLDGGCFYPPRDYEKWGALVTAYAAHVKERYPDAESSWQWELWNEPDLPYWQGTFEEFARLYDTTEAALHAVFPSASLGGPAVAGANSIFLRDFLEHCATGTNAVSGQTGTRLDMVSFHAKGGVTMTSEHVQMNLGNQLRLHRAGFDIVKRSAFTDTPIVISEADPDGCAACPVSQIPENAYRNSPAYGAYEIAMMKRSLELAADMEANLRGVLTWAFTFPDTPYFAGYRALATNGIHLPVLNAFKLLGSLGGDRLPVTSSGAQPLVEILAAGVRQEPDIDAFATRDADRIEVLVWNYHDDVVDADPSPVRLSVSVPPAFGTHASVTHTRVDDTHGNAFTVWVSQGSPATPSAAELAALREAMEPVVLERERVVRVVDGAVSLSFDLPRFGISLFSLAPTQATETAVPPANDDGCSCRLRAPARSPLPALFALSLAVALARRRRSGSAVLLRSRLRTSSVTLRAGVSLLLVACERSTSPSHGSALAPSALASSALAPSATANASPAPSHPIPHVEPTRLTELPISAYATTLALDDDAAYLLAPRGAYRLVPGEPVRGIQLELGNGATMTRSAFVFWSEGGIWKAPKTGGTTRRVAKLSHRPQYFVASGEDFAWVSLSDDGVYTIQTLAGAEPKTLVSATGELSALNMVREAVYFVERPTPGSWRIGIVRITGGAPEYMTERSGRRPALLTGEDAIYFYDVDRFRIRRVSLDLRGDNDLASDLVCSPLHVARGFYCGSVEGLFEIKRPSHTPRVLSYGRPGSITNVQSDAHKVVWTVDLGPDRLAVDLLPTTPEP